MLSATIVQKRPKRSIRLLNDLKNHWNRIVIVSDENTFTVEPAFNNQNHLGRKFWEYVSDHSKKKPYSEERKVTLSSLHVRVARCNLSNKVQLTKRHKKPNHFLMLQKLMLLDKICSYYVKPVFTTVCFFIFYSVASSFN